MSNNQRVRTGFLDTIYYSWCELGYYVNTTIESVKMLVTGGVSVNELSGPVGIVQNMGQVYEESVQNDGYFYAFLNMLNWTIMLSANLGVMNLLPIPALDGGRLVFLIIEAIRGKAMDPNKEGMVHMIGILLLFGLMFFVMFNDIRKLFL
jgi:regulator of sigma E protease